MEGGSEGTDDNDGGTSGRGKDAGKGGGGFCDANKCAPTAASAPANGSPALPPSAWASSSDDSALLVALASGSCGVCKKGDEKNSCARGHKRTPVIRLGTLSKVRHPPHTPGMTCACGDCDAANNPKTVCTPWTQRCPVATQRHGAQCWQAAPGDSLP
jgi:hypothetical protein